MLKITSDNVLEGIVPPSDCEKNLGVKWLTGTPTGSFYIGDKDEERIKIRNFIDGKKKCKVDSKSFFTYLDEIDEIVKKFKHMFYGPLDVLLNNRSHFESLKEEDRYIYISYTYPERYLKTSKFDPNVREFKHSLAANITHVRFEKSNEGEYTVFVSLVENWREVIMSKSAKCNNDSIVIILNDFIKEGLEQGKEKIDLARLFGIKYASLIDNNDIDINQVLNNSDYSSDNLLEYIENGMVLSSDIIWESKKSNESNGDLESQIFDFKKSSINDGQNLIVYGTPGCGKSYYVQHTLLKGYPTSNYIRTTFFQDYTNTDFVGQILPVVEGEKVTYVFNPGPFTLALEQAIRKPNERVALVIEELNRGSAASIFGDIFQLLDRKEGVSEYAITNVNILNYLKQQFEGVYTFEDIRLPGNLSIFATMNTSDQNVFTLDTAFKRRWKFKKLLNKFESDHTFKDMYIPGADITWKDFVDGINLFILESSNGLNSEDKQLGVYFVDEKLMRKDKKVPAELEKVEAFAYKVLEYLWSDVAKFDRPRWFEDNIKSLDMLVEEYKSKGIGVFNHDVFNK